MKEKDVDLKMRGELRANLPWLSSFCNFEYSIVVLSQVRILHKIGIAVKKIHRLLLYAARSICCLSVCLSPSSHPHAESPHSLSLGHSNHCTTFTPVPKHIQFQNCEVSINRTVELFKVFIVLHRLSCLCNCAVLNSKAQSDFRRLLTANEEYRWQTVCGVDWCFGVNGKCM
jgi:hypothetical protein